MLVNKIMSKDIQLNIEISSKHTNEMHNKVVPFNEESALTILKKGR